MKYVLTLFIAYSLSFIFITSVSDAHVFLSALIISAAVFYISYKVEWDHSWLYGKGDEDGE